MQILLLLPVAIIVFLSVLLFRTLKFKPEPENDGAIESISFDKEAAVTDLQKLIQCATVSYYDHAKEDNAEFEKLISLLPELYPNVYRECELNRMSDRALLFRWKGSEQGDASVLMAHFDVVPVEEENWSKPPFAGILENGVLWGRGALDTKPTFNGILFAANHLIGEGFTPKNDIYFAFSGGEEVNGPGATMIVDWFEQNHIKLSMVVDEGGAVVENVFPGVKKPCGLIGIAEKGMMDVTYSVSSSGGHASAPGPHTPIGELSLACSKIESHPFPCHITKPVAEMYDTLGRHSSFLYRMIFANLWCFKGVLDGICKKGGGQLNALMRTTVAFTQMTGSKASNVIPPTASMVSNIRLNPEDSVESGIAYLKSVIGNERISVTTNEFAMNPSPISRTDCDGWYRVKKAVASTWTGCVVAPYLMVQCSDSRHYGRISDKVYRFSAQDMTKEEMGLIHGNNERIRVESACRACEFFIRLMKQC